MEHRGQRSPRNDRGEDRRRFGKYQIFSYFLLFLSNYKNYILLQKSIIASLFIFNQIAITRGIDLIVVKEEVTEMMDLLPLKWEDYHTRQL